MSFPYTEAQNTSKSLTPKGLRHLEDAIRQMLSQWPTLDVAEAAKLTHYKGTTHSFMRFLNNRFRVMDGVIYADNPTLPYAEPAPTEPQTAKGEVKSLLRRLVKTVERQATEIDNLRKEVERLTNKLRQNGTVPTLSERAKRALVEYGD